LGLTGTSGKPARSSVSSIDQTSGSRSLVGTLSFGALSFGSAIVLRVLSFFEHLSLTDTRLAATRIEAKHLFDVSPRMFSLRAAEGCTVPLVVLPRPRSPCPRSKLRLSLETIQRSIELLYYRTSVPSNERLVREANVNATVAERGGKARAIRNRGPRDVRHDRPQANPRTQTNLWTHSPAPRVGRPGGVRPSHLRLVADHGRVIDPALIPRQAARPAGSVTGGEARDALRGVGAAPRREARAAGQGQGWPSHGPAGRGRASRARADERREVAGRRPVRLTRRGRLVVTSTIVLLIAIASMVLAGAAQAAGHP
jgi:hypothetical protein